MNDYLPGKFVWFEHASADVTLARAFYEPMFGWHVERMPMGDQTYHMILNGDAGIGGLRTAEPGMRSHWASYVSVLDIDRSFEDATRAGAKALLSPTDFGGVGRGAAIADPTGAEVYLWHGTEGDRPDNEDTVDGDWCWNELWTPDVQKALTFYEDVFGYTHESMDMGPDGTYYLLKTGSKSRGGITQATDRKAAPMWLPYVHVADCDAALAKAETLGAKGLLSPTDIPGVGRFAILQDPLGAALAIIKTAPRSE